MRRGLLHAALVVALTSALAVGGTEATAAPAKAVIGGIVAGQVTCASAGTAFKDVPAAAVRCDDILWMAGAGIAWGSATFSPKRVLTRGALAGLLYRLDDPNGTAPTCASSPFPDVQRGNRNCGAMAWAVEQDLMDPGAKGRFQPSAKITRGDLSEALYRFAHRDGQQRTPQCVHTRGVRNVNPQCGVIAWSVATGVSVRSKAQLFHPNALVTRSEAARTAHRLVAKTDAAPHFSPDVLVALARADVYITSVDDPHRIHRGRSDRNGQFSVKVPAGDYRVCVDGADARGGARAGHGDACAGGVTWAFDEPTAPKSAAIVTAPAANVLISLPRLAPKAKRHRGVTPPVAKKSGSYTFMTGSIPPAGYNPCQPINVVVNFNGAPAGSDVLVNKALSRVAAATGLRFIYEGTTSEAGAGDRWDYLPDRYGKRWAPVLIAWSSPRTVPDLSGSVIGIGGSMWRYGRTNGNRMITTYTSGMVTLDGPEFTKRAAQSTWDGTLESLDTLDAQARLLLAVITHELGHVVGLGHIDDRKQLMYPTTGGRVTFGPGDLTGLSMLGSRTCSTVAFPY